MEQVGGKHYKSKYQHWDWVHEVGLGYFDGNCTKYIARWRSKGGREDLHKALHYLDKLIELDNLPQRDVPVHAVSETYYFVRTNEYVGYEREIFYDFSRWRNAEDLQAIRWKLIQLLDIPNPEPVPLTEENHYSERVGESGGE